MFTSLDQRRRGGEQLSHSNLSGWVPCLLPLDALSEDGMSEAASGS